MNEACNRESHACCYCCSTSSDGVVAEAKETVRTDYCQSLAHQRLSPNSDHNTGLAVDLTHDPKNGIDCEVIFEKLKEDERVAAVIFQGKIWSRERRKEGNRKYTGSNPHNKHLHIFY
jgi:hypothetical protein